VRESLTADVFSSCVGGMLQDFQLQLCVARILPDVVEPRELTAGWHCVPLVTLSSLLGEIGNGDNSCEGQISEVSLFTNSRLLDCFSGAW